ncbi:MAG: hypothetical protein RSD23_06435 [Ruthenibacterium sp.]
MKKGIIVILCVTLLLTACANAPTYHAQGASDVHSLKNGSAALPHNDESDVAEVPPETASIQFWGQTLGTVGTGCGTEDGYYYLQESGGNFANLMYIDYESRKYLPLCARPECTHEDETCTAYLPLCGSYPQLTANGNHLILVYANVADSYYDTHKEAALAHLTVMDTDGARKRVLTTLAANESLQAGIACDAAFVYVIKTAVTDTASTTALCAISLADGTLKEIYPLPTGTHFIVGAADRNVVVKSFSAPKGDTLYPQDATQMFACIDVDTQKCIGQTTLPFGTGGAIPQVLIDGTTQYVFEPDNRKITVQNLATGAQLYEQNEVVSQKIKWGQLVRVLHHKLVLSEVYEGAENAEDFWIDVTNGTRGTLTLKVSYDSLAHSAFPVVPACTVGDSLLAVYQCKSQRAIHSDKTGHYLEG